MTDARAAQSCQLQAEHAGLAQSAHDLTAVRSELSGQLRELEARWLDGLAPCGLGTAAQVAPHLWPGSLPASCLNLPVQECVTSLSQQAAPAGPQPLDTLSAEALLERMQAMEALLGCPSSPTPGGLAH